jgi:DUF4097 and DUF4098 domain-containing protein YvlB
MKIITENVRILATLAGVLWLSAAIAGKEVDRVLDASSAGSVKVMNTRGDVEIYGWDKDEIRVRGELDALVDEFIFEVKGDQARIEVRLPRHNVNWGDGSNLEIYVPENSTVDFQGVSTDTSIENLLGGLRVRSVSGDITAANIQERVHIKTVSGDIDISDSSGEANIATVSGEIEIEMDSGKIMLDTVSGDIEAELEEFSELRANAVSGGIEVEGKLVDNGDIDMSSVSSDLVLKLAEPINAHLVVETGPGGEIENFLTDDEPIEKFHSRMGLEATLGSGEGTIKLRTVSGDVRINDAS